jgi:two-component system, OmpR family, osmolarity sensor histidine kinase EnvZ
MSNQTDGPIARTLVPRGLYARAALILFLPVVVVTLVVSVMFLQRHFEGVTRQMTASMSHELAFVARLIDGASSPEAARRAGISVARPLELALELPADPVAGDQRLFYDFSGRVVTEVLREALPRVISIDLASDDKQVVVALQGPAGPYALSFDRRRVSASNPHQLLVLMVFTSLLMTGIATIFLRNQLRPIRRLASAAEEYGKGRMVPYRPQGAAEIRSAGTAFLDMRNRLERQNEQRKLMMSGISHDLRTPLTRLRLSLSMVSPDMPPDAEEIAAMEADIAEMSRMVDGFLDYARDEAQDRPPRAGRSGGISGNYRRRCAARRPARHAGAVRGRSRRAGHLPPRHAAPRAGEPDRQCRALWQPGRDGRGPRPAQPAHRHRG